MANVQSTNASSDVLFKYGANTKTDAAKGESTTEEAQNRFLKLLVTQLRNQDPLNPLDNAQMTSQLAQMSTVSGIEKLNTTLTGLVDSFGNSQAMQASELIGKSVLVPGAGLSLTKGQAYGGVNLAADADQVKISILDKAGNVLQTQSLGDHKAGVMNFAWDGMTEAGSKAPDGAYTFKVEAVRGGSTIKVDALQIGTVSALVRSKGGFLLDLGAQGTVDFKNVQQVL